MGIKIRRIIDMFLRVLGFVHANPFDDPAYLAAVGRLEDRGARLQTLATQERSGHVEVKSAVVTKQGLRAKLDDFLMVLARLAGVATQEEPSMPIRLSLPKPHSSQQVYLNSGRVVLSEALSHQDVLGKFGLTPEFLGQFKSTLDQYEQAIGAKDSGTSAHIGANAEMQELATEITRLVRLIDAIQRPRFRHDPEKRAAWKSARTVVRRTPKAVPEPAPETETTEPAVPPKDSATPAA